MTSSRCKVAQRERAGSATLMSGCTPLSTHRARYEHEHEDRRDGNCVGFVWHRDRRYLAEHGCGVRRARNVGLVDARLATRPEKARQGQGKAKQGEISMRVPKTIKRIMLGAVTAVSGVFLACCYGVMYSWSGIVRDVKTKAPISGIEVACMVDGAKEGYDVSSQEGTFVLSGMSQCDSFEFTDVDGVENGSYSTKKVLSLNETAENIVELDPTSVP
ncbi:MAG: hypothetical protein V2A73_20680 [Pseudomonadota bacterium]